MTTTKFKIAEATMLSLNLDFTCGLDLLSILFWIFGLDFGLRFWITSKIGGYIRALLETYRSKRRKYRFYKNLSLIKK